MQKKNSCGFKILDKLGVRIKKSKTPSWQDFLKISLKVTYFPKKTPVKFTAHFAKQTIVNFIFLLFLLYFFLSISLLLKHSTCKTSMEVA